MEELKELLNNELELTAKLDEVNKDVTEAVNDFINKGNVFFKYLYFTIFQAKKQVFRHLFCKNDNSQMKIISSSLLFLLMYLKHLSESIHLSLPYLVHEQFLQAYS